MQHRPAPLGAALFALAALPALLPAQVARVNAARAWTSHPLLDDPQGVDVRAALPAGLLSLVELGFTRLNASADGTGIVCAGLVDPTACAEEPFTRRGRLSVGTLSASLPVLRSGAVTLALTPELGLARASSQVTGRESGNRLEAAKWLYAIGAGAAIRYRPFPVLPLQLQAGWHLQRLTPVTTESVADGYTPFDRTTIVRRLEVGVSLGLPGALR